MDKEYKEIKEDYLRISNATRNKLTALSLTIIVAIYFFIEKENAFILKLAFMSYVSTVFFEIIAGFLKSQHYSKWFDRKIKTIDYRESWCGKLAELFFWIPIITFIAGTVFFMMGIF